MAEAVADVVATRYMFPKDLGTGTSGKVCLAVPREDEEGEMFAVKFYRKRSGRNNDAFENEKSILEEVSGEPFLMKMYGSYSTLNSHCLVLEYCSGGSLRELLSKRRKFSEENWKFYISEILLGVEALHKRRILHLDIKLENVAIQPNGHLVIIDFGFSVRLIEGQPRKRSQSFGTYPYVAPEIVLYQGWDYSSDWYSVGVLSFILLAGYYPHGFTPGTKTPPYIPKHVSKEARDFLAGLLSIDPKERLGGGSLGVQEIKDHPFLCNLDWRAMINKKMIPPYVPSAASCQNDV